MSSTIVIIPCLLALTFSIIASNIYILGRQFAAAYHLV